MTFFFNDTATTEIYTLSLHDALPISRAIWDDPFRGAERSDSDDNRRRSPTAIVLTQAEHDGDHSPPQGSGGGIRRDRDRKSTRLNSSHANISYAVFCLKKKHPLLLVH